MTGNEYSEKSQKELTSDDLRVIIQSNGIDISAIDSKCTLTSQDIKALKMKYLLIQRLPWGYRRVFLW